MIKKQIDIDCWEVYESYDRDTTHIAYFVNEMLAYDFIQSKGINKNYYSKCHVKKSHVYNICESLDEFDQLSVLTKVNAALAKLTKEEKELLGLMK